MALQQGHGIGLGKVFKLNHNAGPACLHCVDELVDECIIFVLANARVTHPHVHGIFQRLLIVSANVQRDRQGVGRRNTAAGGVQRELANSDTHTTNALIAKPQHPLTVGDYHNLDLILGYAAKNFIHVFTLAIGDEDTAGAAIDIREFLTGIADRWGVNNRHHFHQVFR